jgi:hypothetical protein
MNTKKALGALLGLLGSLPAALAFLPLAAGFSAPLLFTANLQRTNGSKKNGILGTAQEQIWIEGKSSSLGIGPGGALGFGSLHDG